VLSTVGRQYLVVGAELAYQRSRGLLAGARLSVNHQQDGLVHLDGVSSHVKSQEEGQGCAIAARSRTTGRRHPISTACGMPLQDRSSSCFAVDDAASELDPARAASSIRDLDQVVQVWVGVQADDAHGNDARAGAGDLLPPRPRLSPPALLDHRPVGGEPQLRAVGDRVT
jgi:hypothetical protein